MGIRLGWLRDHGDLLRTLLRRELRAKYKGSALGVAWSYLYPLLMMAVYTVVFSVLWDSGIPHYPLVVLTGLTAWSFFQSAVYGGATSLVSNAQIIKKVWFPREIVADRRRARSRRLLAGDDRGADTRRPLVRARVALAGDAARDPHRPLLLRPRSRLRVAAGRGERLLPRRRALPRRAVPALVLPDAGLLPARGAAGRGRPPGADPDPALGQPRHAVRGGPARRAPGRRRARRLRARLHGGRGAGLPPVGLWVVQRREDRFAVVL